jgi:nitric oxide synthase oxygenase domain/subunit
LHNKPKAEVHLGHKLMGPKEEKEEHAAWRSAKRCVGWLLWMYRHR